MKTETKENIYSVLLSLALMLVILFVVFGLFGTWPVEAANPARGAWSAVDLNGDSTDVTILTCDSPGFMGQRGVVVFVYSLEAGDADFNYVDPLDNVRTIVTKTMTASTAHVQDFDYPIPELQITFNASGASPGGIVSAECLHY